jgi:hypothetical protein
MNSEGVKTKRARPSESRSSARCARVVPEGIGADRLVERGPQEVHRGDVDAIDE